MKAEGRRSPYFRKRKRDITGSPISDKRSAYFLRTQASCFGSLKELGPIIFTLSRLCRPSSICQRTLSCVCCNAVKNDALSHFYMCETFRTRYEKLKRQLEHRPNPNNEHLTCWERESALLQESSRHLCSLRCYFRLFEPTREWIRLRNTLHAKSDAPLDLLFAGWTSKLGATAILDNDSLFLDDANENLHTVDGSSYTPNVSVVFVSPDLRTYRNKNEAARVILDQGRGKSVRPESRWGEKLRANEDFCGVRKSCDMAGEEEASSWRIQDIATPLGLLEELFGHDPWKLLISTIFLNRTSRVQVDAVLFRFFNHWSSASAAVEAEPERMARIIQPLGLKNRRANGIIRFSKEYLHLLCVKRRDLRKESDGALHDSTVLVSTSGEEMKDGLAAFNLSREDVAGLFNCGDYAWAAYQLFILRDMRNNHEDHALTWYKEYQQARNSTC